MPKKTKPKIPKKPKRDHAGRPPIHPAADCRRTMVRSTRGEEEAWHAAASVGKLTIGPWARKILNQAARNLGIEFLSPAGR